MSEKFTLSATKREVGKAARRETREAGNVLAVVYGHGFDPIAIAVKASDALRVYRKAGNSALINLELGGKSIPVLIKTAAIHPVRHELAHIDFIAINEKEETIVAVPLRFIGESPAVKLGGTFLSKYHTIEVRCLPSDIPESFVLDISSLEHMNDHLAVKDLHIDETKFEVMGLEPEVVVCSVAGYSATTAEDDAAAATEAAEVEVTGEKEKEEKEGK